MIVTPENIKAIIKKNKITISSINSLISGHQGELIELRSQRRGLELANEELKEELERIEANA